MNDLLKEPKVAKYTELTPYAARALILNLERDYSLTIRVYEAEHYCQMCIDKEEKKDVSDSSDG